MAMLYPWTQAGPRRSCAWHALELVCNGTHTRYYIDGEYLGSRAAQALDKVFISGGATPRGEETFESVAAWDSVFVAAFDEGVAVGLGAEEPVVFTQSTWSPVETKGTPPPTSRTTESAVTHGARAACHPRTVFSVVLASGGGIGSSLRGCCVVVDKAGSVFAHMIVAMRCGPFSLPRVVTGAKNARAPKNPDSPSLCSCTQQCRTKLRVCTFVGFLLRYRHQARPDLLDSFLYFAATSSGARDQGVCPLERQGICGACTTPEHQLTPTVGLFGLHLRWQVVHVGWLRERGERRTGVVLRLPHL